MAPIENEASVSLTIGVAYEYQPASPAHDRRHDHPAYRREDAEELHPLRQEPCGIYRQVSGDGDGGRPAALSPPLGGKPARSLQRERIYVGAVVFLRNHAW